LTAANRPDKEAIGELLDARLVRATADTEQHLCLDKGYDYADAEHAVRRRRYVPHILPARRGGARLSARHPVATMGRRAHDVLVQSLPEVARPVGEKAAELPRPRLLRRCASDLAAAYGIGSKAQVLVVTGGRPPGGRDRRYWVSASSSVNCIRSDAWNPLAPCMQARAPTASAALRRITVGCASSSAMPLK